MVADRRKIIVIDWFESLKIDNKWKNFVNTQGKLRPTEARKALAIIENGEGASPWNDSYFKDGHWSKDLRSGSDGKSGFEGWVREELSKRSDRNLFGNRLKEDLNLPLWLENLELPESVVELLENLAKGRTRDTATIKSLEKRINQKDEKILQLETFRRNVDDRHLSIEEHSMGSVRTLAYNADMDVDLSIEDLFSDRS